LSAEDAEFAESEIGSADLVGLDSGRYAVDRDPQTGAILGAAIEVHKSLGCGFLEAVYHSALSLEMYDRCIPFRHEVELPVLYKGRVLDCRYRADFVCFDGVIVELKAMDAIGSIELAQVMNYLKATGFERALILKFGAPVLDFKRVVRGYGSRTEPKSGAR
jgi:GxxExxY protein